MPKPTGDWRPDPSVSADDWVGLVLDDRYQVTSQLGAGGMGFVYKARDRRLGIDVVLKVPRPEMLADAEFRQRFRDEIAALVHLSHPHIVKVTDYGLHEGTPFAVMQYLPGGSLDGRRPRDEHDHPKPVAPRTLTEWLGSVADALDFIHSQGVVHRDIKPANILFDAHRHAFISDFGVAKAIAGGRVERRGLTGAGMVLGTPEYLAPEVILGQPFDGRIDQYALAVTVYEMLSGQPPLLGPTGPATMVKQTTETPKPLHDARPGVPAALSAVISRALAKNPSERYATCAEFAQAALKALGEKPADARPAPPPPPPARPAAETPRLTAPSRETRQASAPRPPPPPPASRSRLVAAIVGGIALLMLAIGYFGLRRPDRVIVLQPLSDDPPAVKTPESPTKAPAPPGPPPPPPAIDSRPAPIPQPRHPTVRIVPEMIQILAGAGQQTVHITFDGPLPLGGVTVIGDAPAGIQINPQRFAVLPESPTATVSISAAESARPGTETLRFDISGADVALTGTARATIRQPDFSVKAKDPTGVTLRPGQSSAVRIVADRGGGYMGPIALAVPVTDHWEAARAEIAAGATDGVIALQAKPGAKRGDAPLVISATAPRRPIRHSLSVPAHVVDFELAHTLRARSPSPVTALAFDRTGQQLLVGAQDGSVSLWTLADDRRRWSFSQHKKPVRSLAFSPDGKRIIFQAEEKGTGNPFYQIFVMDLDTGAFRRVSPGIGKTTCADFSPDGKKIIFASTHLDPDAASHYAPEYRRREEEQRSGQRRRYSWDFDPYMDIFEADLDGSNLKRLTTTPGYDAEGSYSPDGKQIVFCSQRDGHLQLWIMNADGSGARKLTNAPNCYNGGPFFSPDGKRVVFRSDRKEKDRLQLYVINADGTGERALTDRPTWVNWGPFWHPDGKHIVYSGADHGTGGRPNYDVYWMNVDTGKETRLTFAPGADVLPVFSRDGKKIMWTSTRDGRQPSQIYIADFVPPVD